MREALSVKHLIAGIAMFLALGASLAIQPPKAKVNAEGIGLETIVPSAFGDWTIDPMSRVTVASPDVARTLAQVYSEILSRTYVNTRGERVMLSVAYTGDIDRQMDVHRPEVCYPAQGFSILKQPSQNVLSEVGRGLAVRQLVAKQGVRIEPITYWIATGDTAVASGWQRKLVKLRYNLTGQVPEGMLVRVSTIDPNVEGGFRMQADFVRAMLGAMSEKDRVRFVGSTL